MLKNMERVEILAKAFKAGKKLTREGINDLLEMDDNTSVSTLLAITSARSGFKIKRGKSPLNRKAVYFMEGNENENN